MDSKKSNNENTEQFTMFGSWDRVKYELLNRYYDLMNTFRDYQYQVLSSRDHQGVRRHLTCKITNLWFQMRNYKKTYTQINNFDKADKDIYESVKNKSIFSYEQVVSFVAIISKMFKEGGLTNIEFEKADPNKAITEGMY